MQCELKQRTMSELLLACATMQNKSHTFRITLNRANVAFMVKISSVLMGRMYTEMYGHYPFMTYYTMRALIAREPSRWKALLDVKQCTNVGIGTDTKDAAAF